MGWLEEKEVRMFDPSRITVHYISLLVISILGLLYLFLSIWRTG